MWLCKPCCPSISASSIYHPTPSLYTTTNLTSSLLMELNRTIPFIIKPEWPVTLGANQAGCWWRFGFRCRTVTLLPAAIPTSHSLPSSRWTGWCPHSQLWSRGEDVTSWTFVWLDFALVDLRVCVVEIGPDRVRISIQENWNRNTMCDGGRTLR